MSARPASTAVLRQRVFFVVVGDADFAQTLQQAVPRFATAVDFDVHVLEQSRGVAAFPSHDNYTGAVLPTLSPEFLFPGCEVVYIVCGVTRLHFVQDGVCAILVDDRTNPDASSFAIATARLHLAKLDVVHMDWSTRSLDDAYSILCHGARLTSASKLGRGRVVDAGVVACGAKVQLPDAPPWLTWADFVARVDGSEDVARALHDAGSVVALPSLDKPEFAALSLAWLFDMLRHIFLPTRWTPPLDLCTFTWSALCVDRQLESSLLGVVWPETQTQLRDALLQYFESVGVLGTRIAACPKLPMLGDRWLVRHLIWCDTEAWPKLNEATDVDDWRVPAGALHCLRRRFEVASLSHEVWRRVLQLIAAVFRVEVEVGLAWIKVTSLQDDETLVIFARKEALSDGADVTVFDVMCWYPACWRGAATFRLFETLLPVVRQAVNDTCGPDVREGVPLLWDGTAGLGWSHADASTCCTVARHGSVGVVAVADLVAAVEAAEADGSDARTTLEPVHTLRRSWNTVWGPRLGAATLQADGRARLLSPSELGGAAALVLTPEPPRANRCVTAHRHSTAVVPYSWRQLIPWCELEGVVHVRAAPDAALAAVPAVPSEPTVPAPKPMQDVVTQYLETASFDAVYQPVGKGGYGAVWHAIWHAATGDVHVAVKASLATADEAGASLRRLEVNVLNAVRAHPNVVRILGFCGAPDVIVMEYLEVQNGKATLRDWCRSAEYPAMSHNTLVDIAAQLCAGFAYVHSVGVLHCDIKPSNVLMVRDETCRGGWRAKVSDFGISAFLKAAAGGVLSHVAHHATGTRGYQAPEQAFPALMSGGLTLAQDAYDGDREYTLTPKSDVFSFGILLFRLFCGGDNSTSSAVAASSAWDRLASSSRGSLSDVTYALDVHSPVPIAPRMRNSLLFAKASRTLQLPTLVFVVAEWCLRPQPAARPSFAQLLQVFELEQAQPNKWHQPFDDDVDVAAADDYDDDGDMDVWLAPLAQTDDGDAFAAAVWRRAHALWHTTDSAAVFLGLPRSVVVRAVLGADADAVADSAEESVGALVDPIGNDVVTFAGLKQALRGCTDAATACIKARRPLFAVPPLPTTPFVTDFKDVVDAATAVAKRVREANEMARWDATMPGRQQFDELEQLSDEEDGDGGGAAQERRKRPDRVFAITGAPASGKSRFLLEAVHSVHREHPTLFSGGIVFASLDNTDLTAASLFTTLSGVMGLSPTGDSLRQEVQRWCARQSLQGNVLLAVDGGTSDIVDLAALLHELLFDNFDGGWDTLGVVGSAHELRVRPNRVFCLVAGSCGRPPVLTAVAATPHVVHSLRGLTSRAASALAKRLVGHMQLPDVETKYAAYMSDVSPRLVHVCCGPLLQDHRFGTLHEETWSRALIHALWCRLNPMERAVLARLSVCRAPMDEHVARRLCSDAAELPQAMRSLVAKGVLLETAGAGTAARTWLVPAFISTVVLERRGDAGSVDHSSTLSTAFVPLDDIVAPPPDDVSEPLLDAALVDAATAAFVKCFAAVLGACARAHKAGPGPADALALFDHHRLALLQLLELGRAAMHQPHVVRTALLDIFAPGVSLMGVLVMRVPLWELLETCCSLWLCAWAMPHSSHNARRLVVASLCLRRALYLMDGGDDAVAAGEFGLSLAQRVTARSMQLDAVAPGNAMPRRMVRDAALVADALSAVAIVLSEDRRADTALNPGVKVEYERLLLYTNDRLAAMKRVFSDPELHALKLTNDVFLHLPAMWTQNSELAKLLGPSVAAVSGSVSAEGSRDGSHSELDRVPLGPAVALPLPSLVSDRVPGTEGTAAFSFASLDRVPLLDVPSVRGSDGVTWEPAMSDPVKRIDRALLLYCQCLLTRMLYLGTSCRDYASTWYDIGNTLADRGLKYAALVAYKRSRMVHEAVFGKDHPTVALTVSSEAAVWHDLGKHDEALRKYTACLTMRERMLGTRHIDVARTRSFIAIVLHAQEKFWTALHEFVLCTQIRSEQLGLHPDVAATLNNHAIVLNKLVTLTKKAVDEPASKPALSLKDVQQAYELCAAIRRWSLGHIHPDVAHSLDNLAVVLFKRNERDRAVRTLQKCVDVQQRLGKEPDVAKSKFKMGVMQVAVNEDAAFQNFQSCLELRRRNDVLSADVRATLRDVTAVFHLQLAMRSSSLRYRYLWLDMQMQTLTDIAAAAADKSFPASASAPRLGMPVYRYIVDATELAPRSVTAAPSAAGSKLPPLVDADVATNMVGIGQTLVTLLSGMNAHMPHLLDVASRCTLQGVAVAELQLHGKIDSRMAKDLASARINAGDVFMRRGAYEDAAWEYSLAVELVRPIAETVKPMFASALLGTAEAVARTDPVRSFAVAMDARRFCDATTWPNLQRRFQLLANKLLMYDDDETPWLSREDVLALTVRVQ